MQRLSDLTVDEVGDLFVSVQKIGRVLEHEHAATSLTISLQDGPEAGQSVNHVHVHVLPRKKNDFKVNDDIYEELQQVDIGHDQRSAAAESQMSFEDDKFRKQPVRFPPVDQNSRMARSIEEMESEASSLRNAIAAMRL